MKRHRIILLTLLAVCLQASVYGQEAPDSTEVAEWTPRSSGKAFAMSLLLPGLGHRYARGGSWRGLASVFALADAGFWASLVGTVVRRDQVVESFHTLAATEAGAQVDGKGRRFFLNLATFRSSDDFLDAQLRSRNWDEIDYVSDPAFQWEWTSEEAFQQFRDLRDKDDALGRRRTLLISVLVANRLIAGLTAIRAANRANEAAARDADVSVSFGMPPAEADWPLFNLQIRF